MKNSNSNTNTNDSVIKQKITFDNLTSNSTSTAPSDQYLLKDGDTLLVNKEIWKKDEFSKSFFKRKNYFSSDENELKDEFNSWHKELGEKIFDKERKKFTKKFLMKELNEYVKLHPNLTLKDEKKLELINKELKQEFFRYYFLNLFIGCSLSLFYLRYKSIQAKQPLRNVVRQYYFKIIFIFFLSNIWLDITFKLKKPQLMADKLNKKKMIDKYFIEYL
jgi:hypothetical protein